MVLTNTTPGSLDADFHAVPTVHLDEVAGADIKAYVAATADAKAAFEIGDTTGGSPPSCRRSPGSPHVDRRSRTTPTSSSPTSRAPASACSRPSPRRRVVGVTSTSTPAPRCRARTSPVSRRFILGEHPQWCPMAVKSAMMTTAFDSRTPTAATNTDPFAQGAGHVDPTVLQPGPRRRVRRRRDWPSFFNGQGLRLRASKPIGGRRSTTRRSPGPAGRPSTVTRTFTGLRAGTWTVAATFPASTSPLAVGDVHRRRVEATRSTFTFTRTTRRPRAVRQGLRHPHRPHHVRMPVALRPVSVTAPASVAGTGAERSHSDRDHRWLHRQARRQAQRPGQGHDGRPVDRGQQRPSDLVVTIAEGTSLALFVFDSANNAVYFDLYVYRLNAAGTALVDLVDHSATGAADETVHMSRPRARPVPRPHRRLRRARRSRPPSRRRTTSTSSTPRQRSATSTADPNPVPVTQGETTSYDAVWSGLTTGRYLGMMEYDGALSPTYVTVSVN